MVLRFGVISDTPDSRPLPQHSARCTGRLPTFNLAHRLPARPPARNSTTPSLCSMALPVQASTCRPRSASQHSLRTQGLASEVLRQQEEERLWAIEKHQVLAPADALLPPSPPPSIEPQAPLLRVNRSCDSLDVLQVSTPLLATNDDPSSGAAFLAQLRRQSTTRGTITLGGQSIGPPCGARTSIPDRVVSVYMHLVLTLHCLLHITETVHACLLPAVNTWAGII